MNDIETIASSLAYCGLMCRLCFRASACDGCKTASFGGESARSRCERDLSDEGCPNKTCCLARGISGCWECAELEGCAKGMYGFGMSPKVKAFAVCVRDEGARALSSRALENAARGWSVEKGGPYDDKSLQDILRMLRDGPETPPLQLLVDYCLGKEGAYIDCPFGDIPICIKRQGHIFAEIYPKPGDFKITLRCDPPIGARYDACYPDRVVPAHHVPLRQRPHKRTILLGGGFDRAALAAMIDHSYENLARKYPVERFSLAP